MDRWRGKGSQREVRRGECEGRQGDGPTGMGMVMRGDVMVWLQLQWINSVSVSLRHQGVRPPPHPTEHGAGALPSMGYRPAVIRRSLPVRSHIEPMHASRSGDGEVPHVESSRSRRALLLSSPSTSEATLRVIPRFPHKGGGNARQHASTQTSNWPVPPGEFRFAGRSETGIMQRGI